MYSRGQFAIIGKVGRKALRLYEEEGILVPQKINVENGYRYYDENQFEKLYRIQKYRKYGLALAEIRDILTGLVDEEETLDKRRIKISHEIQESISIKNQIEKQIGEADAGVKSRNNKIQTNCGAVEINTFPARNILFRYEKIDLEHLGMSVGKLYEMAAHNGITVLGTHYVRYDDIFDGDGEFQMQTCLPISGIYLDDCWRQEEECKCLHIIYSGGFSTVGKAHQIIKEYAETNHIELNGTAFEVYNSDMSAEVYYKIKEN